MYEIDRPDADGTRPEANNKPKTSRPATRSGHGWVAATGPPPKIQNISKYQYGARTRATSTRRCQDPRRIVGGKGGRARTSDPAPDARSGRDMASRLRSGSVLSRYVEIRKGLVTACSRAAAWKSRKVDAARARGGPIPLWRLALPGSRLTEPLPGGGAGGPGARAQRGRGRVSALSRDPAARTRRQPRRVQSSFDPVAASYTDTE